MVGICQQSFWIYINKIRILVILIAFDTLYFYNIEGDLGLCALHNHKRSEGPVYADLL